MTSSVNNQTAASGTNNTSQPTIVIHRHDHSSFWNGLEGILKLIGGAIASVVFLTYAFGGHIAVRSNCVEFKIPPVINVDTCQVWMPNVFP